MNDALTPLVEHGAEPLRSARRRRLGHRPGVVLDRLDARADELRVDAGGATRSSSSATAAQPHAVDARRRCCTFVLDSLRDGAARRRRRRRSCSTTCAPTGPWTGSDAQLQNEGRRPRAPRGRHAGVPVRMKITRRQFVKGGVAAFTVTFAAPAFLSDLARAQGARGPQPRRAVSERRQRRAQHADPVQRSVLLQPPADASPCRPATCCRSAPTRRGVALGLHPRLTGLRQIFDAGPSRADSADRLRRTRAARTSRAPTSGRPANPANSHRARLGRPLPRLAAVAGRSARRLEHDARSAARAAAGPRVGAGDPEPAASTRSRARTPAPRPRPSGHAAIRINSHVPVDRPELAFVYGSAQAAMATLDRVAHGGDLRRRRVTYPNTGVRPGAAGRRRRDGARHRHEGLLRHDRRLRHALRRRTSTPQRRVLQPDGRR